MTVAAWRENGWDVAAPQPVGDVASLLEGLREPAGTGGVLLGIDCPLGLPREYARRHCGAWPGFRAFVTSLPARPEWLRVCGSLEEVSGARPFYPMRGRRGMTRSAHAARLDLADSAALSRICDRATATRNAGAPMFWTLGANQSGKAAIAAWRDLVLPALQRAPERLHLWPFDGDLAQWASSPRPAGSVLLAETYPAEALDQLGLRLVGHRGRGSKRRQSDRASLASALRSVFSSLRARLSQPLQAALGCGFGADAAAEDRFDSVLGLTCVLRVLMGRQPDRLPADPWVHRWEGWVLGLGAGGMRAERTV